MTYTAPIQDMQFMLEPSPARRSSRGCPAGEVAEPDLIGQILERGRPLRRARCWRR